MSLVQLPAPSLADVSVGVATLQYIEPLGFSAEGRYLLVKTTYTDSADPNGSDLRYAVWVYDLTASAYVTCLNLAVAADAATARVTDVDWAGFAGTVNGVPQIIVHNMIDDVDNTEQMSIVVGSSVESNIWTRLLGADVNPAIQSSAVSADGRFLAIQTDSTFFSEFDTNGTSDIYLIDLVTQDIELVSVLAGAQIFQPITLSSVFVNASSVSVSFTTEAAFSKLDTNGSQSLSDARSDAYVWTSGFDAKGLTGIPSFHLISRGTDGKASGFVISEQKVLMTEAGAFFESSSDKLITGDINNANDVFVTATDGVIRRVDLGAMVELQSGIQFSGADSYGRYVALLTSSPEVVGISQSQQLIIVDQFTDNWFIASSNQGIIGNDMVVDAVLSQSGNAVAFVSLATNLSSQEQSTLGGSLFLVTGFRTQPLQFKVYGTSGNDKLVGIAGGMSEITGGGGNDSIAGKDRADVAVYTGNRSDYTVTTVAGVITVVDNRPGSPDGTDIVRGMNILRFADSQLFVTAAANRTTLAGVAQTFEVANSEFVTGTAAAERFIIHSGVSAFVSAGTGDTVDLAGAITDYTYKASGNQLQISDGVNTTVLTVGGAFTLRTASGSTSVVLDFAAGGVIKLGTQVVGSVGFDAAAAITNVGNTSSAQQGVSTTPPTVTALTGSSDSAPTLTGTAVIGEGQTLEVTVNGVTYTTATGVVLGAGNTWSLTLPSVLAAGTYSVEAVIVPSVDALNPVAGTSGADTLTGLSGVVNVYTGGGGNDSITGKDRADVAVYTGNRSDYTVTTVAGVITVVDNRPGSPDGIDTVRGMNILRFADSQLFVTAAANRTTLAGVAQTFEVANSEFVTGTAAAERFIIHSGVSAFVSAGTGDTVDLSGAITDYTYKASGNQLQVSDGVNTTVLTVGGAFTLRTASGSTSVVLDFAAGGVIKLGTQVVGSVGFDAAAAITNAGNLSGNAIPAFIADTSSNELVINDPVITVANGGVYTAIAGKVDTFVIDANQTITATIIGFAAGDIIEIRNSSEEIGVNFDNTVFGDGNVTIFVSASATLNLTGLASDSFGDESSFESIYGSEAISYAPLPMSLSMTPSTLSEPTASDSRLTPTTMPVTDLDAPLAKMPVKFMPANDDLDQLLANESAAGGESIHEPINGFWSTPQLLGDFAYPDSFDLYSLRTSMQSSGEIALAVL
jgi:hypothetical protein